MRLTLVIFAEKISRKSEKWTAIYLTQPQFVIIIVWLSRLLENNSYQISYGVVSKWGRLRALPVAEEASKKEWLRSNKIERQRMRRFFRETATGHNGTDSKYFLVFLSTPLKPLDTRVFEHLFCKQSFCLMVCLKVLP